MNNHDSKEFLKKHLSVPSYFSDLKGELSIPSLFHLFQEVAWEHATINQFGYTHLHEKGLFWALSRVQVEIAEMPKWTNSIVVKTWPSGIEGAFALRDFTVENEKGKRLVSATSSWLIVDIESRRPKRPNEFKDKMPICETIRATNSNAQKLVSLCGSIISSQEIVSKISDIDINGHINNTKYIEWAINSILIELYSQSHIRKISVNFLSEGFCKDRICATTTQAENGSYSCEIIRQSDSQKLCVVQFDILPA